MRILAFSFFPAFVPAGNGGESRLYNFYRELSRYQEVTLLTSTHLGVEEETIMHGVNFIERRIPKDHYFFEQYSILSNKGSGGDLSGPSLSACSTFPTLLHKAYLEEYRKCDAVFHDSPFTVDYDLFAELKSKPRIYNSYNCETLLYKQLHPAEKSESIQTLVAECEKKLLNFADLVLYCNEADLCSFRSMGNDSSFDAVYAPNGMTPAFAAPNDKPEGNIKHAVFMGSGHPPNVQAAKYLVDKIAPHCPDIVFDFIGSCLPRGDYANNISRHGVIDDGDKRRILSRANFALNPMAEGSGSNVKVLEYFSYGIVVISTHFGMRGINAVAGEDYIEASLDNFLTTLKQANRDLELVSIIASSGKKLAETSYTWRSIVEIVNNRLESLFDDYVKQKTKRFILALNDYDSFDGVGGGHTRTQGLYETVQNWSDVVFLSFSSDQSLRARKHSHGITVITVPKTPDQNAETDYVNSQYHVSAEDILSGRYSDKNIWLINIYEQLRTAARCIVLEHCYMTKLPLIFGDRFVCSSQNNETFLKHRLLENHPLAKELLDEVALLERLAIENSALTIAVSQEDAESLVKGRKTCGPVMVVPNGSRHPATGAKVNAIKTEFKSKIGKHSAVFVGSAHMPNIQAAEYIVNKLANTCPDISFHIIGSVCSALKDIHQNVTLWGIVDEVTKSAIMQSCSLALNPMQSGSGSNVKQADYFANGLYVVSTGFGQRGYPDSTKKHSSVTELETFSEVIQQVLGDSEKLSAVSRQERYDLFNRELAMERLAARFTAMLQGVEKKRKRVLYVAYRYTVPAMGGAEINIEKFVSALGNCDGFDVDVISSEISSIHNDMRFSERYAFNSDSGVPVNIPNVRFARFKADDLPNNIRQKKLRDAWVAQVCFEKELNNLLEDRYINTGLTYGWAYPESDCTRWAFSEFGIFVHKNAAVELNGYAKEATILTAYNKQSIAWGPEQVFEQFSISLKSVMGEVDFITSKQKHYDDPRPLSVHISKLTIDGTAFDVGDSTLMQQCLQELPGASSFYLLDRACEKSRSALNVRLTDIRGPWSAELELFIKNHVQEYDLVVAHNNVFRPAVVAMSEAKKHGVASILVPHAHLDDDFYHFPDLLESARNATQVLAVPKAACDFYESRGCSVSYLPAGCNSDEQFTAEDQYAFHEIYASKRPFILVLGRKAGAKGYQHVIDAVVQLKQGGTDIQVVLIGPDDDGVLIKNPNAVYLGRQPRNIVRGALLSCVALVNMSSSESFGIVLLEAWMAGKPVIANKHCVAFHDMGIDGVNALLVDKLNLTEAILLILNRPDLASKLAGNGKKHIEEFAWNSVSERFVNICKKLTYNSQK